MLITCQSCATSYEVGPSSLGPSGRSVRCARCGHVWFAANTEALSAIAQAHRAELGLDPPVGLAADEAPPPLPVEMEAEALAADGPLADPMEPSLAPSNGADAELPPPQEPIEIVDAPALVPAAGADRPVADDVPAPEDIESVAARRTPRKERRGTWPAIPASTTAILALIAANLALVAWRTDVVRLFPQTASLYSAIGLPVNLRGLAFSNLTTGTDGQDGVPVLTLDGEIVNVTSRPVEVPRLRFSVRNDHGNEVYTWTALPPKPQLAPGETMPFRSRLASPPRDGKQVLVRFFNRRDLASGIQ